MLRTAVQLAPLHFLLQLIPGVLHRCLNTVAKRKATIVKENLTTADETMTNSTCFPSSSKRQFLNNMYLYFTVGIQPSCISNLVYKITFIDSLTLSNLCPKTYINANICVSSGVLTCDKSVCQS